MRIETQNSVDPVSLAAKLARTHWRWHDEAARERTSFVSAKYPADSVRRAENKAKKHDRAGGDEFIKSLRREPTTYRGIAYQLAWAARFLRGPSIWMCWGSTFLRNDEIANELAVYAWAFARRRPPEGIIDRLIALKLDVLPVLATADTHAEFVAEIVGKAIRGIVKQPGAAEGLAGEARH